MSAQLSSTCGGTTGARSTSIILFLRILGATLGKEPSTGLAPRRRGSDRGGAVITVVTRSVTSGAGERRGAPGAGAPYADELDLEDDVGARGDDDLPVVIAELLLRARERGGARPPPAAVRGMQGGGARPLPPNPCIFLTLS